MSRKGVGKGEREVIVEHAVTERATSLPNACLFAFKSGPPEQTKTSSVCYGEERRYELLSMIEQSDIIRATSLPNA